MHKLNCCAIDETQNSEIEQKTSILKETDIIPQKDEEIGNGEIDMLSSTILTVEDKKTAKVIEYSDEEETAYKSSMVKDETSIVNIYTIPLNCKVIDANSLKNCSKDVTDIV